VPPTPTPAAQRDPVARFLDEMARVEAEHRPSRHPFFAALASDAGRRLREPAALGELYHRYQSAMHATRVMVYHLPHLDAPSLRVRKVRIYVDDDGLPGGDTHHDQLRRAFTRMGAPLDPATDDARYGDLAALEGDLDPATRRFVAAARAEYARSLGPWCAVETLSDDWLHALADGLSRHLAGVRDDAYFADCFRDGVEHRHGQESLAVTSLVLRARPALLAETVEGAWAMARGLDALWDALGEVIAPAGR
jgi:hypothetical protein